MLSSGNSKIKGIRLGGRKVLRVLAGRRTVWGGSDPFLSVSPDMLWLLSGNDSADCFVCSNTSWNAEISTEQI